MGPVDFRLESLDGNILTLTPRKNKVIWLNFWATWCTACADEIPTLNQLQATFADDLVVLGISLDGVPDAHGQNHDEHDGEAEDEHQHDHETARGDPRLAEIRHKLERYRQQTKISYTILLDPENQVGSRFNGGELPTNVLIDQEGYVRRRFLGDRSIEVFQAMVQELGCKPSS